VLLAHVLNLADVFFCTVVHWTVLALVCAQVLKCASSSTLEVDDIAIKAAVRVTEKAQNETGSGVCRQSSLFICRQN